MSAKTSVGLLGLILALIGGTLGLILSLLWMADVARGWCCARMATVFKATAQTPTAPAPYSAHQMEWLMSRPEVLIEEEACREALRRLNINNRKLGPTGQNGWPDRMFMVPRCPAFVEFKRPGEKPTKLQEWRLQELRELGYAAEWFDNSADCVKWLATVAAHQADAAWSRVPPHQPRGRAAGRPRR